MINFRQLVALCGASSNCHFAGVVVSRPYFPELIECLRDTLRQIERVEDGSSAEVKDLKRRIILLLADLQETKTKVA